MHHIFILLIFLINLKLGGYEKTLSPSRETVIFFCFPVKVSAGEIKLTVSIEASAYCRPAGEKKKCNSLCVYFALFEPLLEIRHSEQRERRFVLKALKRKFDRHAT